MVLGWPCGEVLGLDVEVVPVHRRSSLQSPSIWRGFILAPHHCTILVGRSAPSILFLSSILEVSFMPELDTHVSYMIVDTHVSYMIVTHFSLSMVSSLIGLTTSRFGRGCV